MTRQRKGFVLGLISIVLSVVSWVLICRVLYPMMDYRSVIRFATFEKISLPISLVPLIIGILALLRKEKKLMAVIGIVISSLTCLLLLFLIATDGM